ncbi:MAG: L-threonylcarbamoyladenylate synthase [Planctomycetia bacterium]|nr:L-threonylcarbamoyladenylate synthase [Planctomycetia bacterium]
MPRGPHIPDIVTAGGVTLALRCPEHRLTRRLIDKVGSPLAAPSANRSEAVSATTAHHVLAGLGNRVELILDGGSCGRGIESTVVDCTVDPPRILRPGPVVAAELQAALGGPVGAGGAATGGAAPARSPGTRPRHYAPQTPLEVAADADGRVTALLATGGRVGWMTTRGDDPRVRALAASRDLVIVPMPNQPQEFARVLYATLHALDQRGLDRIVVDQPSEGEEWQAVRDRLTRAAAAGDAPA